MKGFQENNTFHKNRKSNFATQKKFDMHEEAKKSKKQQKKFCCNQPKVVNSYCKNCVGNAIEANGYFVFKEGLLKIGM